jgi:hypothetical protein
MNAAHALIDLILELRSYRTADQAPKHRDDVRKKLDGMLSAVRGDRNRSGDAARTLAAAERLSRTIEAPPFADDQARGLRRDVKAFVRELRRALGTGRESSTSPARGPERPHSEQVHESPRRSPGS